MINTSTLIFLFYHQVSFAFTPINKGKLIRTLASNVHVARAGHLDDARVDWSWPLRHPLELVNLICQHQQVSRRYVYLFAFSILMHLHMGLKNLVQVIYTDAASAKLFDKFYYFNIGDSLTSHPNLFNGFFSIYCAIGSFCLLNKARKLISEALINRIYYRELNVSHLNFTTYCAVSQINWYHWQEFAIGTRSHLSQVNRVAHCRAQHFSNNAKLDRCTLQKLTLAAKLYYLNLVDFSECYLNHPLADKFKGADSRFANWHIPQPAFRISLKAQWRLIMIASISLALILGSLSMYWTIYLLMDVRRDLENLRTSGQVLSIVALLRPWFSFKRIIKSLEMFLFNASQTPFFCLVAPIVVDAMSVVSRIERIFELVLYELENGRLELCSNTRNRLAEKSNNHLKGEVVDLCKVQLNEKLERHLELFRLVYLEFLDIKATHTFFLNTLLVGPCFSLSYGLTMLYVLESRTDIMVAFFCMLGSLLPGIVALVVCASVERKVSLSSIY